MPHLHRFFATPNPEDSSRATLRDEEAHHAIHVVRLREGEEVQVFDGRGRRWDGAIESLSRRDVVIRLTGEHVAPHPDRRVTLVQAWLHRDKSVEEIIRRCTEVGVDRFVFFPSERSERKPRESSKWERLAVESCKQCGRAWLPEFAVAENLHGALACAGGTAFVATRDLDPLPLATARACQGAALIIGPEGDFTPIELELLVETGVQPVHLGEAVLRSEVAAFVGCSLLLYEMGRLG